ncbi:hypothetical protein BHE74_00011965 [Ensete ventricosum]|nr:hypothetical protein BHE74_00011965 [Ensete ventricosum]
MHEGKAVAVAVAVAAGEKAGEDASGEGVRGEREEGAIPRGRAGTRLYASLIERKTPFFVPLLNISYFASTPFTWLGNFTKFHPGCFAPQFILS